MPDVSIAPDPEALSRLAADRVATIAERSAARGRFTLALSGGSTPRALYGLLVTPPWRDRVPWRTSDFFWGDERLVPLDDPDSNVRLARETLLDHVPVPPERVHVPPVHETPPAKAAALYERDLVQTLGAEPRFDLVLLGLGPDGHTASLFPDSPELEDDDHLVVATARPHNGHYRLTLTLPVINAARNVLFLVSGADKREALRRALDGDTRLPAARVRLENGTLVWLVDRAAYGE